MWAAAEGVRQCALLEWMISLAKRLPLLDINGQVITSEGSFDGWMGGPPQRYAFLGSEFQGGFVRMDSQPRVSASSVGRPRIMNMLVARDVLGIGLEFVWLHPALLQQGGTCHLQEC